MKAVPEVWAIVGTVAQYGSGHLRRMELLRDFLSQEQISMSIVIDDGLSLNIPYEVKVLLLDRRDTAFPPTAMLRHDRVCIAIDNLAVPTEQVYVPYFVLPHVNMSLLEMRRTLRQIILPPEITHLPNRCAKAQIVRCREIVKKADLVLYPYRTRLAREIFLRRLKAASTVACYYGQTFFEALYLGKKIFLYDISLTHRQLANTFFQFWRALPYPQFYFDGRGLERLALLVKQAIHGGLPDPTT